MNSIPTASANDVIFPGGLAAEDDGSVKIHCGAADTVECLANADAEPLVALCTDKRACR